MSRPSDREGLTLQSQSATPTAPPPQHLATARAVQRCGVLNLPSGPGGPAEKKNALWRQAPLGALHVQVEGGVIPLPATRVHRDRIAVTMPREYLQQLITRTHNARGRQTVSARTDTHARTHARTHTGRHTTCRCYALAWTRNPAQYWCPQTPCPQT
jgi:hypothetical protein